LIYLVKVASSATDNFLAAALFSIPARIQKKTRLYNGFLRPNEMAKYKARAIKNVAIVQFKLFLAPLALTQKKIFKIVAINNHAA